MREFDAYPSLVNSRHPLTDESYHFHSRHFALPGTEERVGGIDRSFDRSLLAVPQSPNPNRGCCSLFIEVKSGWQNE
jgi:hypothetical protein